MDGDERRAAGGSGGAHQVSVEQSDETERTLAATPGLRGEPTDAERARTLAEHTRHAALATVGAGGAGGVGGARGTDGGGYPFGSLVGYAPDESGRPLLCLSDLAEHSVNLAADPRASLLVSAVTEPRADPLAGARVTLVGHLGEVPEADREAVHHRYRQAHPEAFYSTFADFRLYRLEVRSVRYVGGFGRMSWVGAQAYRDAAADPLHTHAAGIIDHMNDDHADALVLFCTRLAGRPETGWARMVTVDRYGFDVLAGPGPEAADGERRALRMVFEQPCDTPTAVRAAMVALVRRARAVG